MLSCFAWANKNHIDIDRVIMFRLPVQVTTLNRRLLFSLPIDNHERDNHLSNQNDKKKQNFQKLTASNGQCRQQTKSNQITMNYKIV